MRARITALVLAAVSALGLSAGCDREDLSVLAAAIGGFEFRSATLPHHDGLLDPSGAPRDSFGKYINTAGLSGESKDPAY